MHCVGDAGKLLDRVGGPETLPTLLPILTIAIRSVRAPEARHGLAAIVSAIEQIPQSAKAVQQQLPELQLDLAITGGGR